MGALRDGGEAFVEEMIEDEASNGKSLGEMTFKVSRSQGFDINDANGLTIRKEPAAELSTAGLLTAHYRFKARVSSLVGLWESSDRPMS